MGQDLDDRPMSASCDEIAHHTSLARKGCVVDTRPTSSDEERVGICQNSDQRCRSRGVADTDLPDSEDARTIIDQRFGDPCPDFACGVHVVIADRAAIAQITRTIANSLIVDAIRCWTGGDADIDDRQFGADTASNRGARSPTLCCQFGDRPRHLTRPWGDGVIVSNAVIGYEDCARSRVCNG
jgi:hypothetical protein